MTIKCSKTHLKGVADWIKLLLETHKINVYQFAIRANVPKTVVYDFLNCAHEPTSKNMSAIAAAISELTGAPCNLTSIYDLIWQQGRIFPVFPVQGKFIDRRFRLIYSRKGGERLLRLLQTAMQQRGWDELELVRQLNQVEGVVIESTSGAAWIAPERVHQILNRDEITPDELAVLVRAHIPNEDGLDMDYEALVLLIYPPEPDDLQGDRRRNPASNGRINNFSI